MKLRSIFEYGTIFFDCDGVLLDSNDVKSNAFYEIALPYGEEAASRLRAHHRSRGGISRFVKIQSFFFEILGRTGGFEREAETLLANYARLAREGMLRCRETSGARELLEALPASTTRYVVSGSAEDELREVLGMRGFAGYFHGVFGSPRTKLQHLESLLRSGSCSEPAVFIGDSYIDYASAKSFGVDFIFMTAHTECDDWERRVATDKDVRVIRDLRQLMMDRR